MDYTKLAQQFGGSQATVPKTGGVDYSALASKFGAVPVAKAPQQSASGMIKYDVAPAPIPMLAKESSTDKIARYNKEQIDYDKKAKKSNSFGGLIKETVKGTGKTIASSEIGLGETLGKIGSSKNLDIYTKNIDTLTNSNLTLQRLIKEREARGEDVSSLKRAYNSNIDVIEQNKKDIGEYSNDLPTNNEVLGQFGGTALDVLTAGTYGKAATAMKSGKLTKTASTAKSAIKAAAPEASKIVDIASKPAGIFTKKGATNVAKGAGIGYAVDITEGMQGHRGEDRKDGKAFIPGLGTAIGTAIPAVTETTQSFKNRKIVDPNTSMTPKQAKIVSKYKKEIDKIESGYQKMKKVSDNPKRIKAKENLAKSGLLNGAITADGKIDAQHALKEFNDFINPHEGTVTRIVEKEGVELTKDQVLKKFIANIEASDIGGKDRTIALNNIKKEVAGLRTNKNGKIDLGEIQKTKIYKGSNINYFDPVAKKYDKTITRSLKELVEENTKSADVHKINKDLSELYDMKNLIVDLNGKVVKGGRLGKYFAKIVGAVAGAQVGGLPGGILGSEISSKIYGKNLQSKFKGKTGFKLQPTENMKLGEQAANRLHVKSLPSDYTNELPTIAFGEKGVSKLQSQSKNLPVADGAPKVFFPEVKSKVVKKKPSIYNESYTPNEKLPIIPAGSGAPKKKLDLPVVEKSPNVYLPEKKSQISSKVSAKEGSTSRKASKNIIPSTILPSTEKVNISKTTDRFLNNWIRGEAEIDSKDLKVIEQELSQYKPKKPVKLYRGTNPNGKETGPISWTYNKEAAKMHAEEAGGKVISKIVHPDEILVDLMELPGKLAQKYGIMDEEEEVILKTITKIKNAKK